MSVRSDLRPEYRKEYGRLSDPTHVLGLVLEARNLLVLVPGHAHDLAGRLFDWWLASHGVQSGRPQASELAT